MKRVKLKAKPLMPNYTFHCFTCVLDAPLCFHWRFGYQHIGIENASENARKT